MMKKWIEYTLFLCLSIGILLAVRVEAVSGTFTPIVFPGATSTEAWGINDAGEIAGNYVDKTGYHAFLYSGGNYSTLEVPGATSTYACGINNSGQIVGYWYYWDADNLIAYNHGFVYDRAAKSYQTIDYPYPAGYKYPDTYFFGINNSGEIVGSYGDSARAFSYSGGSFHLLKDDGAYQNQGAFGINDSGYIVGSYQQINSYGFLYKGALSPFLTHTFLTESTIPEIWWEVTIGGNTHGVLYKGNKISIIDHPDASSTQLCGINNHGMVVGTYVNSASTAKGSFIYSTLSPRSPSLLLR